MKKICYVTTIPITIKAFFVKQLQYLSCNGFDVTVICSPDSDLQSILGSTIKYIPVDIPRGISVVGSISAIKSLISIFRKEKFDLIQYSTPNAALYSSIASKVIGCKVRNYHLMGFRYMGVSGMGKVVLKWIEKYACNNSTHIECVSKSNLEIGIKDGIFKRNKATIVWNGSTGGVDLERFNINKRDEYRRDIRAKYAIGENEFVFGFVGRITRDKGVNEILVAFSNIHDARLMMVGNTEGTESLNQVLYLKSLKDSRIVYTGLVSDVEKYYTAIDALLLPSYREGFGNVVIEAGAMGTPAIVSDIPGPIDTVAIGKTALLVQAKNAKDLKEKMLQIRVEDYTDMGKNAAQYAKEKFDSEILCRKIVERKEMLLEMDYV